MNKRLANFALFQVGWFACVLGGNVIGALAGSLILIVHFTVISPTTRELRLVGLGALIGISADQLLLISGLLTSSQQGTLIPCWLIFLWLIFMTCIDHSLSWMRDKPWLAAVGGAVCAPLSYYAGVRLGAIGFGHGFLSALAVAGVWAIVMPLVFRLSKLLDAKPTTSATSHSQASHQ